MKFITTFHHGFAWRYFEPAFAFDGADPRHALLYTEPTARRRPRRRSRTAGWPWSTR